MALCPGGTNRLTGELSDGFFGSSCDADEHEEGGFGRKAVVPGAVLVKAHMPDLATVVPVFNVESIERTPGDMVDKPLPPPGRVREHRLQQALHRHRPEGP